MATAPPHADRAPTGVERRRKITRYGIDWELETGPRRLVVGFDADAPGGLDERRVGVRSRTPIEQFPLASIAGRRLLNASVGEDREPHGRIRLRWRSGGGRPHARAAGRGGADHPSPFPISRIAPHLSETKPRREQRRAP